MAVVEILDANGAKKKIDVQTSGEGLEQLVADLGVKTVAEAIKALLEGTGTVKVSDGGGSLTVDGTVSVGEPTVKVAASQAIALAAGTAEVGKVKVTELPALVLAAGSAAIGKLAANAGVNIGSVGLVAASHEGVETKLVISAASTNSTLVKASAGKVFGWHIFNKEAVPVYVKLYNAATAPTVGTTAQLMVVPIPAGAAANVEFTNGIAFSTGIGLGITKGAANANTEAVAAEGVIANLLWK